MTDTFLPRVAYHAQHDPKAGLRLICLSLSTCIVGAALSMGLFVLAPYHALYRQLGFWRGLCRSSADCPSDVGNPRDDNLNLCTSNLYMFNYGHERAWSF